MNGHDRGQLVAVIGFNHMAKMCAVMHMREAARKAVIIPQMSSKK